MLHVFLMVTSIYLMAMISPGPDFIIVARTTLLYSRYSALFTALGISAGVAVHLSYCVFCLSLIVNEHYAIFLDGLKYIGGAYLIFTGLRGCFDKKTNNQLVMVAHQNDINPKQAFMNGLICNLFNPKACLFFISIFTLLTKQKVALQYQTIFAMSMVLATIAWFSLLTYLFTLPRFKHYLMNFQNKILVVLNIFLIVLGIYLLTLKF